MTERYINNVRLDQGTWNKVKDVQEIMERRDRRRFRIRLRGRKDGR